MDKIEEIRDAMISTLLLIGKSMTTDDVEALARAAYEVMASSDGDAAFVWKWIERAMFDDALSTDECLSALAHYPGAPWNEGRWNVDHKPYAERFYKRFPKARAALTQSSVQPK